MKPAPPIKFKVVEKEEDMPKAIYTIPAPAPLKDKELLVDTQLDGDSFGGLHDMFLVEDVASAVKWLKCEFARNLQLTYKETIAIVDMAFADVVEVKDE